MQQGERSVAGPFGVGGMEERYSVEGGHVVICLEPIGRGNVQRNVFEINQTLKFKHGSSYMPHPVDRQPAPMDP